ncbi:PAXB1-like protein [Mya arenaria]|uniref:PAXB1-like protein n=1 Tax=Mya arenaria TaxID=6604 RepID=A0ABY7EFB5_MYAAR|nr:PAXB1-like protein [Mya arenaria]
MASMFRKPKRNFRQRVVTNDSDDDENENDTKMEIDDNLDHIQILPEPPKKPKEKTNMHKSSSVLSFDNDEAKQLKKEIEQEQEMRKTSKVGSEVQKEVVPQKADEGGKEVVEDRIKKLREELLTMNGDEAVALEDPESDEEGTFKKMLKRGEIPDATTIHQIRKQRQMARDMGDFMPLDDTVQLENSKSRLIRLTTMEEVHRGHKQEADKLEHDIEDSQMAIVNCEAGASKLEERFTFFQEMRGCQRLTLWKLECTRS